MRALSVFSVFFLAVAADCVAQWPQWGRTGERNNVAEEQELSLDWEIVYQRSGEKNRRRGPLADLAESKGVRWSARVTGSGYRGMHSPPPVVSGGKVFVGSNYDGNRIERYKDKDYALMLCLRESDGDFLWQHSNKRLEVGKVSDWEWCETGSTPYVEGDRLWYVSNRCEVFCLDAEGFHDGENDGVKTEEHATKADADVIWSLDLREEFAVFPHNFTCSSITCAGDLIFLNTGNGMNWTHRDVPSPEAPSFLALDKHSGEFVWEDNSPGDCIMHGSWSSPAYGVFDGVPQVIFGGGDGWLYSFDPKGDGVGGGKLLWKFDCNPKRTTWFSNEPETRSNIVGFPVIADGHVFVALGQEPEHGDGKGRLLCIDPTRRGDVSEELVYNWAAPDVELEPKKFLACDEEAGDFTKANPNSALVWAYEKLGRSCGSPVIAEGLLIVSDASGVVYCLSSKEGTLAWKNAQTGSFYGSPLIADGHIYVGNEDGEILVYRLSPAPAAAEPVRESEFRGPVCATPIAVGSTLFVRDATALFAIGFGK